MTPRRVRWWKCQVSEQKFKLIGASDSPTTWREGEFSGNYDEYMLTSSRRVVYPGPRAHSVINYTRRRSSFVDLHPRYRLDSSVYRLVTDSLTSELFFAGSSSVPHTHTHVHTYTHARTRTVRTRRLPTRGESRRRINEIVCTLYTSPPRLTNGVLLFSVNFSPADLRPVHH